MVAHSWCSLGSLLHAAPAAAPCSGVGSQHCQRDLAKPSRVPRGDQGSKSFGSRAVGKIGLEMWLQLQTENVLVDLRLRWRMPGQCCARVLMLREAALCRAHTAPGMREVELICQSC